MRDKKYELTEEQKAQIKPWTDKWTKNALSTTPMTDEDRSIMRTAVKGLYEAVSLKAPAPERIIFVASPQIAEFAAGLAHAALERKVKLPTMKLSGNPAYDACMRAVYAIVNSDASLGHVPTDFSPVTTTEAKDGDRWFTSRRELYIKLSNDLGLGAYGIECAQQAYRMKDGGNQWSSWACFLTFYRYVVKLDMDYSAWDHYEKGTIHGGPRYMHEEFCIVSDKPELMKVDGQDRPHNETGPFCRWSDGFSLYSLNGVRVPQFVIESPKDLVDTTKILQISNVEERQASMKHVGIERFLDTFEPKYLDTKGNYKLCHLKIEGDYVGPYLLMTCPSTGRRYLEGVGDINGNDDTDPSITTVDQALQWRFNQAINNLAERSSININNIKFSA